MFCTWMLCCIVCLSQSLLYFKSHEIEYHKKLKWNIFVFLVTHGVVRLWTIQEQLILVKKNQSKHFQFFYASLKQNTVNLYKNMLKNHN